MSQRARSKSKNSLSSAPKYVKTMSDTPKGAEEPKNAGKASKLSLNVSSVMESVSKFNPKKLYDKISKRRGSKQIEENEGKKPEEVVRKKPVLVIGKPDPKAFEHKNKMTLNPRATWGIDGMPEEWKKILQRSGITKERFLKDNQKAIKVVQFVAEGQKNVKIPLLTERQLAKKMKETAQIVEFNPSRRYEKVRKIGEGAGGVVWEIKVKKSGEHVAVKISNTDEIKFIRKEIAYHALSDNHKNIVNYHETFLWKDEVWIVMDLVVGGCLTEILGEECTEEWNEALIAYVMHECLNGLKFMHDQHLLHRDIKSDNVLVGRDGTVKLADFGFAVGLSQEKKKRNSTVGTPFWMAPEVIQGDPYDDRCDIWSLGITAIEIVNDEPPHMDKEKVEALLDIVTLDPPVPNNLDMWSDTFLDFLANCLIKDYKERWNANQLLAHDFLKQKVTQEEFSVFASTVLDNRPVYDDDDYEDESEYDG